MAYKILLVEDNQMNRDMLSRRLIRNGYEVIMAEDGVQAIKLTEEKAPDIILMDMSLPVMDGWEASKKLKEKQTTQKIPIIALTAHAMTGDRDKAMAAGCDDFDTKPVDFQRLSAKIESWLTTQK